ncbi:uncharacterized protein LOC135809265 isoform X2 [Sycon ciliatum]|uniref:uncharacterized protein LOC135809265 isoform X2 n=1 Tax=Sycon ciliatum TaxID=27933 RepID=UPI0031F6EEA3
MEESDETSASDAPTSEGSTVTPDSSLEFEDEDFIEDLLGARTPSTPSLSDIHKPGAVPEEEDLAERALARSIDELQSAQKRGKGRSRVARFWLDAAQAEDENGVDKPPLVELLIASDLRVLKGLLQNWRFGKEEFRSVMHEALSVHLGANFRGKFSLEEIDQFYDLVNPLLEDTISWEHICSYAFEQHLAKDEIRVVSQIPEWGEFTQLMPEGRERVAAIVLHCGGQRRPHYMIVSRPGVITRLDANFRVQQTKQVEELLLPRKTIWVHDAVIMGTLQKMAVALSTKCVLIYDIERDALSKSGRHRVLGFPLIHRISGFTDNVLTKLFFWQDEEHAKKCKLIVCDDGGLVSVFHFYNAFNTLLLTDTEKWRQNIGADQRTDEVNVLLCNGKFEKSCVDAKFNQFQPHAEPARHVLYLPSVKAYITCHPITKGSIVITYARSRRRQVPLASRSCVPPSGGLL